MWTITLAVLLLGQAPAKNQPAASNEPPNCAQLVSPTERDKELETQLRPLLRDLRSGTLQEREAAEQKLMEFGARVLDYLPEVNEKTSAELKQRLARVRDKLQKLAATDSGKATQVTLQGELTLAEILSQISRQTGNRVTDGRSGQNGEETPPEIKLKLDLDKVSFWQALDTICEQGGLAVNAYPEAAMTLALNARGEQETPQAERRTAYSGPFKVEVSAINARHNLKMSNDRRMNVVIDVSWEPRLAPLSLQLALADVKAVDDQGNEIAVSGMGMRNPGSITGVSSGEITIPFSPPSRGAKKIASLKGKITALVPGRQEIFCFSGEELTSGRPVEKRRAGAAVRVGKVRVTNDQYEMHVFLQFDEASAAMESYIRGDWLARNEIYMLGPGKERIEQGNSDEIAAGENEAGKKYFFDKNHELKDCVLVYTTPSVMLSIPVEFEIKDIDLP